MRIAWACPASASAPDRTFRGEPAGARTLAATLAEDDHAAAFRRYEAEHRRRIELRGRGAGLAAALLIPKSRAGIVARNAVARLLPAGR
jgi:2-polyprenyl-6-methoxyphenol hydroxylase-like FAD-dependent oxidoreductase